MRASMAASRQSQAPGAIASAAATAKLLEKKKEYEAVAALERASAHFLKRIEDIGEDFDVIADAGIVSQREQPTEDESAPAPTTGERLVRVPIEELRQTESKTT
ncbi:hypothetical protein TRAPUB_10693 [Trametes pubescens]|uniref:Uncharacterized protein n=1 Tax=Trametes pubescens TaxID=154538 RepID=A0A1M2VYR9_TRAPU|nr:hypothetical protein TRAPUB_10693 [Trametes pubescens]